MTPLARLTRICLALPEAVRIVTGRHAAFVVGKRTFAYFLDDHHGDGITAVTCKAAAGVNSELCALLPDKYYVPAYLGPRGWVALRLDGAKVDWSEVRDLVQESYQLVAPKRLASAANRTYSPRA